MFYGRLITRRMGDLAQDAFGAGCGYGGGAGGDVEFGEDVGEVRLDGGFADVEACGDVAVGVSGADEFEDLDFA